MERPQPELEIHDFDDPFSFHHGGREMPNDIRRPFDVHIDDFRKLPRADLPQPRVLVDDAPALLIS